MCSARLLTHGSDETMRTFAYRTTGKALTLLELMIVVVALAVLVLAGWVTWEMSHREAAAARARTQAYQNGFAAMERLKHAVMRAMSVEIPDPDYDYLDSMQVVVLKSGMPVRRAFRLVDDELTIDYKDEAVPPFVAFDGIS